MKSNNFLKLIVLLTLVLLAATPLWCVVITEIMPRPSAGGEWLELYNETGRIVNLVGWWLRDETGDSCLLTRMIVVILPREYLIVAEDDETIEQLVISPSVPRVVPETWVRLNDDGDHLYLINVADGIRDKISYNSEAGKVAGRSWERIDSSASGTDPFNWGPCADPTGHTAGKANSLQIVKVSKARVRVDPNPFNPFLGDVTAISFKLPAPVSRITVSIFNSAGRRVRQLISNIPAGTREPLMYWDGRDDRHQLLPIGRYIIYLEALDSRTGKVYQAKCTTVVAANL